MAIPMRNNEAQDADAVYILGKIKAADDCEAVSKNSRQQAHQYRIEAGLRLIEVNKRVPDKAPSGTTFSDWCDKNNIPRRTAYNLMRDAGFDEEQREEHRAKERDRKREERAKAKADLGWVTVLKDALGKIPGCKNKKAEYEEKMGEEIPAYFKTKEEADAFVERFVRIVGLPAEAQREQLPKSAEEKLQRAIRVETAKLHQSYHDEVEKGIKAELADRIAHLEQLREKAAAREKRYDLLIAGIKPVISKDDYRFLLNVFHSDRTPTKDKLDKAFIIVKKLEPYID